MGFTQQEYWSGLPSLLQIFQTQELNPSLLHCRYILYHLNHQGRPRYPLIKGKTGTPTQVFCLENPCSPCTHCLDQAGKGSGDPGTGVMVDEPGLPSGGRKGLVPGGPRFQVTIVTWSVFTPNTVMGSRGAWLNTWGSSPTFRPGLVARVAPVQSSGREAQAQPTPSRWPRTLPQGRVQGIAGQEPLRGAPQVEGDLGPHLLSCSPSS